MRTFPGSSRVALLSLLALASCSPDGLLQRDARDFSQSDGLTVCAAGSTVRGIDVSEWQGSINWSQVAASGVTFAFIRVSDGTQHMDPTFNTNWANAKAAGIIVGVYQFYEPSEDATAQAQVVVSAVGKLGNGELPVMMDVETATPNAADMTTWLNAVSAGTGKTPVIYTSEGLWNRWLPNGGFGNYGLDAANWGASCPALAAGWSNWVFWQTSDNSSIPGISGNVDGDVYNGSLSALQNYATSDQAPRGSFDAVDCTSVAGWAQDLDVPDQAINVDVYYGGPAGSGATGQRLLASDNRADLCTAINSCDHGFSSDTPRTLMDGAAHSIHAYGIDANGSDNAELNNSPKTLTCTLSESGVRRHITDPTSYAAWGFSSFQDIRPVSDAEFSGYDAATPWPSTPSLIRGTGDAAVYLVDGAFKRHVVSPTSATEWHLDLSQTVSVPLAQVQAMPQGPDLRERPTLIKGSGDEIDELDDPLPAADAGSPEVTTGTNGSTGTTGAETTSTAAGSTGSTGTSGTERGSASTGSTSGSTGSVHTSATASGSTSGSTGSAPSASSTTGGDHHGGGCSQSGNGFELLSLLTLAGLLRRRSA